MRGSELENEVVSSRMDAATGFESSLSIISHPANRQSRHPDTSLSAYEGARTSMSVETDSMPCELPSLPARDLQARWVLQYILSQRRDL